MTSPMQPNAARYRWRRAARAITAVALLALGIWAFVVEPASLTVRSQELRLPRWSAGLAGLRVVVLADLHVGSPFNGLEKLEDIIDLALRQRPDLILIPGDFLMDRVLGGTPVAPEALAEKLSRLSAPLGVWATLGNHDWQLGARRIVAAFEARGIAVLEDRAVRLQKGGTPFWLVGIDDYLEGQHDIGKAMSGVSDDAPVLMFTHNPDVFPEIPARASLLVAGHTHGGQVRLPLIGAPLVPSLYGQRFLAGHIVEEGRHLFVSTGLGTSALGVRFRVPPEIAVLDLFPD